MNLFLLTDDFKIRAMVHLEIVFLEVWKCGYSFIILFPNCCPICPFHGVSWSVLQPVSEHISECFASSFLPSVPSLSVCSCYVGIPFMSFLISMCAVLKALIIFSPF